MCVCVFVVVASAAFYFFYYWIYIVFVGFFLSSYSYDFCYSGLFFVSNSVSYPFHFHLTLFNVPMFIHSFSFRMHFMKSAKNIKWSRRLFLPFIFEKKKQHKTVRESEFSIYTLEGTDEHEREIDILLILERKRRRAKDMKEKYPAQQREIKEKDNVKSNKHIRNSWNSNTNGRKTFAGFCIYLFVYTTNVTFSASNCAIYVCVCVFVFVFQFQNGEKSRITCSQRCMCVCYECWIRTIWVSKLSISVYIIFIFHTYAM